MRGAKHLGAGGDAALLRRDDRRAALRSVRSRRLLCSIAHLHGDHLKMSRSGDETRGVLVPRTPAAESSDAISAEAGWTARSLKLSMARRAEGGEAPSESAVAQATLQLAGRQT